MHVRFPALPDILGGGGPSSGSGTGSTQPREVSTTEELLDTRKSSGSCLENREYDRRDPSRWPRCTLYPQKLAIASPISGGRSVGIVRSRTQTMEFVLFVFLCMHSNVTAIPHYSVVNHSGKSFIASILLLWASSEWHTIWPFQGYFTFKIIKCHVEQSMEIMAYVPLLAIAFWSKVSSSAWEGALQCSRIFLSSVSYILLTKCVVQVFQNFGLTVMEEKFHNNSFDLRKQSQTH
jgi:hypothetical protein